MRNIKTVIIAGGQGTRFWPASRAALPKQFLSLGAKDESLLQTAVARAAKFSTGSDVSIVTNERYIDLCKQHAPEAKIVSEPCPRNTAAAVGLGAISVAKEDPDAIMVVVWSDHAVENMAEYNRIVQLAAEYIDQSDALGIIGVKPGFPHTGYGYVEAAEEVSTSIRKVKRFCEKPDLETAQVFYESGSYFWNSGMFVWKAESILNAFEKHMPNLYQGLQEISESLGTEAEQDTMKRVFETMESESIDYGVLEKAEDLVVFCAEDLQWSDVGSWDVWADFHPKDSDGNVQVGEVLSIDSKNNIIHSEGKLTALIGVEDLILIDTPDALLVCPKSQVQRIKDVTQALRKQNKTNLL